MLINGLIISCLIFFIGLFGIIFFRRNYLLILLFLEVLLLSVNYNLVIFSIAFNNITGQILILYIFIIAGVESVLGLSLIILYFKLFGHIYDVNHFELKIKG
jgi:NADH-quinone oxidoreductase subunit K